MLSECLLKDLTDLFLLISGLLSMVTTGRGKLFLKKLGIWAPSCAHLALPTRRVAHCPGACLCWPTYMQTRIPGHSGLGLNMIEARLPGV